MVKVLFLLAAQVQVCCSVETYAVFPQVTPKRQQFFEFEPIHINCEGLMGLTGWRVLKRIRGELKPCSGTWELSTGPCKINNAMLSLDNGEYWCENGAKRSNSVNITVTAGSTILEIPVLPVSEGDNVTLSCRNKNSSPNITTQFFKDGVSLGSSSTGTMTLFSVSRSHEGFYKCSFSGAGGSPQSWLSVAETEEDLPSFTLEPESLWICIGVCIFLGVLLLLVGFLRHKRRPTALKETTPPSVQSPAPTQRVSEVTDANDSVQTTYNFVDKPTEKRAPQETFMNNFTQPRNKDENCTDYSPMQTTYPLIDEPNNKKAFDEACTDISVQSTYALIHFTKNKKVSKAPVPDDSMQSTYALISSIKP